MVKLKKKSAQTTFIYTYSSNRAQRVIKHKWVRIFSKNCINGETLNNKNEKNLVPYVTQANCRMITREKSKKISFGIILNWNRYNPLKNNEKMVFLFIANFLSIHIDVFSIKNFRINNIKPCIWLNNHPNGKIFFFLSE